MSTKPVAGKGLTPKQESFCLAYLHLGNASEAYREAYDANACKPATINRKAKELLDNGKIAARLTELRAPTLRRALYDYDQAMTEANEALDLARKMENPSAMVAAATLRAKLSGLMVEDRKNQRVPLQDFSTDRLQELESLLEQSAGLPGQTDRPAANRVAH